MSTNDTPIWVLELQANIAEELSSNYQKEACWHHTSNNLTLEFPTIKLSQLDFTQGITRALRKYGGEITQDPNTKHPQLIFPQPKQTPLPIKITQIPPQSQQPHQQQQSSNSTGNQVKSLEGQKVMTLSEYIKGVKSNWVTLRTCSIGDKLQIISDMYFETVVFDGTPVTQCILNVVHQTTGQPMKLRLSPSNAASISHVYSEDSKNWIGKTLVITSTAKHHSGKEGYIYGPA